jgi:hypothetical protein
MSNRNGTRRDALRMAVFLRKRLLDSQKSELPVLPESQWLLCQRSARFYEKARRHGWHSAANQIRPQFVRQLTELRKAIDRSLSWENQQRTHPCPSLHALYKECLELREEFSEAQLDLREKTISVTTDPITLESVSLGTFHIELDLKGGDQSLNYRVIATEPYTASNDEDVTHPHVRSETLCEGEGTVPINRALEEGRLSDFFQIVCQILETYNPSSAYVELESWDGPSCIACGYSMGSDDGTRCSSSGDDVCNGCAITCPDCESDFSPNYTDRCNSCLDEFCQHCLEEGRCHACWEKLREEELEAEERCAEARPGGGECAAVLADAAIQGSGVG